MPKKSKENGNSAENDALLKKVLILELFKLGVPQAEIGKKLKMNLTAVNAFLKGCKKSQ
jgi:hypothetical protein